MKTTSLLTPRFKQRALQRSAALVLIGTLAACGGGGDSGADTSTNATAETAQSAGTGSTVVPADGNAANEAMLTTTQAVIAGGQLNQTINCAGGGTALFTATGASVPLLTNGQFDTGEVYSVTYTQCRGSAGAATVNGNASLTVASANGSNLTLNTATTNLVVGLPLRTVTLNGNSTLTQTVTAAGATTTTARRWVSPSITLSSTRTATNVTRTYTLSNVDITRTVTTTSGVVSSTTENGGATWTATLPSGTLTVTLATQGAVAFDANGVPTNGTWTLTLPHNRVTLNVTPGQAVIAVDYGADGTVDRTYTLSTDTLVASA